MAIHNHTLGETDYNKKELAKMHRTIWILLASIAVFFLPFLGGGMKFVLFLVGIIVWWYLGIRGRNQLIASGKFLTLAGIGG